MRLALYSRSRHGMLNNFADDMKLGGLVNILDENQNSKRSQHWGKSFKIKYGSKY